MKFSNRDFFSKYEKIYSFKFTKDKFFQRNFSEVLFSFNKQLLIRTFRIVTPQAAIHWCSIKKLHWNIEQIHKKHRPEILFKKIRQPRCFLVNFTLYCIKHFLLNSREQLLLYMLLAEPAQSLQKELVNFVWKSRQIDA